MLYAGQYDLKPNSLKFTSTSRHRGNDAQVLTGGFRASWRKRNGGMVVGEGGAGAVALGKPVAKFKICNGATNPIHARYYCGGKSASSAH